MKIWTVCCITLFLQMLSVRPAPSLSCPFVPLTSQEIQEATRLVGAMKRNPRGPYVRIRWFCQDGTVQEPTAGACTDHGGGYQHAEYSSGALRLAQLHFHVGTIFRVLDFDHFLDSSNDNYRLKELVLEAYLRQFDDGWILRRALYYRGARQIEDEEAQGELLLRRLLSDPDWTRSHLLLAVQLLSAVPRRDRPLAAAQVRLLSAQIAEKEPGFQRLRAKIHSFPSQSDVAAVQEYLSTGSHEEDVGKKLEALRDGLQQQYGGETWQGFLERISTRQRRPKAAESIRLQQMLRAGKRLQALEALAAWAVRLRQDVLDGPRGTLHLKDLDLIRRVQSRALLLAQELLGDKPQMKRLDALQALSADFQLAFSSGFFSSRERQALEYKIRLLEQNPTLSADQYKESVRYLSRSLNWAIETAKRDFDPVLDRYLPVEPKVKAFYDSLLRGSILLSASRLLERLSCDADHLSQQTHSIFGKQIGLGIRGLNPGVAVGQLAVLDGDGNGVPVDPGKIYVIPGTLPDLQPMAGILTLDSGNLLSHAQLLARNLEIPNATISSSLLPWLNSFRGRRVFYSISPRGRVVLKLASRLSRSERELLSENHGRQLKKLQLDTSRLRLDLVHPLPLRNLSSADSGAVSGPKAANLGQLAQLFPTLVAKGLVLPFGMYFAHIHRKFGASKQTLDEEIRQSYERAEEMRERGVEEARVDQFMFRQLERFRRAIVTMDWIPELRQSLTASLAETFGRDETYSVFVRSDTNAEDLPQFSGAGLNLTVPNQKTQRQILSSIKRVWASPFRERAYSWRKRVLQNQAQVVPSVLLLQSIPSTKSGVLVTTGLENGRKDDLTIATAEGVGGVVQGGTAETVRIDANGKTWLLSQAKAPCRRLLMESGGLRWSPSARPEYLLGVDEIQKLKRVVEVWRGHLPVARRQEVWDLEFGFVGPKLWLFQVRPFVQPKMRTLELLGQEGGGSSLAPSQPVSLEEPIQCQLHSS
ncbi:MAG: PEP/pyruvate-binding domain-containing protein [Acidobacteriota bacterium]